MFDQMDWSLTDFVETIEFKIKGWCQKSEKSTVEVEKPSWSIMASVHMYLFGTTSNL